MDQDDSPRARTYRFSKSGEINLPAIIVDQEERAEFHVVNRGKKLEEGIAWLRDHNFVACARTASETGMNMPRLCQL